MKSTPRNLMAGMNVSRDQKVGRAQQRAKGLPQDGAHAGGQTYDRSKRRETTSNHQTTTSDYEYGAGSFFCRRCWRISCAGCVRMRGDVLGFPVHKRTNPASRSSG